MGKHGAVLSWNPCLLETYKQEWISGQRALQRSQQTQPGGSLLLGVIQSMILNSSRPVCP